MKKRGKHVKATAPGHLLGDDPRTCGACGASVRTREESIAEINAARAAVNVAEKAVVDAINRQRELTRRHLREHPLPETTRAQILERVRAGKDMEGVCCEPGKAFLIEIGLDDVWVTVLNEWAYEALGCSAPHHIHKLYVPRLMAALNDPQIMVSP